LTNETTAVTGKLTGINVAVVLLAFIVGESNIALLSASAADGVLSFCSASFSVLVNFSNDLEHALSFTSYKHKPSLH